MTTRNRITTGDGDPRHGTGTGYAGHKCRCDLCRDWQRADYADRGIAADTMGRRLVPRDRALTAPTMPAGDWADDIAPCVVAPDLWFTGKHVHPEVIDICNGCSFRVPCAKAAIAARAEYGVWAGVPLDNYGAKGRLKALRRVIRKSS